LIDAILAMVDEIRAEAGPISFTQKPGHTVLTAAISAWLEANEPAVAWNVREPLNFHPDDAGALGRSIARRYMRRQHEAAGASMLIAAGLDVVTVSKRLGHASPNVTLRVYAHLFRQRDDRAADAINAALANLGRG
jgi:integrase